RSRPGSRLRQQPPAVHRPGRRHDRPGAGLAAPLRRALLSRLHRARRLPDLMVGVLTLLFAAARLGFLVRAIPIPVTEGFIAAPAPPTTGARVGPAGAPPPPPARSGSLLPAFWGEPAGAGSRRDVLVPGLFAACIAIALLARRLFPRIPDALVVVALAFAATF